MELRTIIVGSFQVNCYLYWDPATGDGVIIDPGDEADRVLAAVDAAGFTPMAVLLTHGHVDHIAGVNDVLGRLPVPLYCGRGEEALLTNPSANMSAALGRGVTTPSPDKTFGDEESVRAGSVTLRVLATPGHSPGGVCYLDEREGILFCGDTLFDGSIGRTDLHGGSMSTLLNSIRSKIMTLPDEIICYPGHGPNTTVGTERTSNPFLVGGYYA